MKHKTLIIGILVVGWVILGITYPRAYSAFVETTSKPISTGPVKLEDGKLWVFDDEVGEYQPFLIKGVGYSPFPIGRHPVDWGVNIYDSEEILRRDFQLLQNMNCNTVRVWKGNYIPSSPENQLQLTQMFFNLAQEYNIKVIAGFWVRTDFDLSDPDIRDLLCNQFLAFVSEFKDYPALLFWAIGNEQNYSNGNNSYWYSLVNEMSRRAYQEVEGNTYHPVAVANGEILNVNNPGLGTTDEQLTYLDIWGANVYRGRSFIDLFTDFPNRTEKPLWISEYGVDAWHSNNPANPSEGYEDQSAQQDWIINLTNEIIADYIADNVCIGGTIMEYSDEWWKSTPENPWGNDPNIQDYGGNFQPGGQPDSFFNQEWFGIMAISSDGDDPDNVDDMHPRDVYDILQKQFQCSIDTPYYAGPDNNKSCDGTSACCSNANLKAKNGVCVSRCGGGGGCPCFVSGTPILMADGTLKPIDKIKSGELVMSFDEPRGEFKQDKVKETFRHKTDKYLIVNGHLKVTENHPVYSQGRWIEIGKLKIGDKLLNSKGKPETITSIKLVKKKGFVYNLEVNPYHTYIAGGILVHNKPAPGSCLSTNIPAAQ